jgi:hypothetical protein
MAQKWLELADQSAFGQRRLDVALDHFNEQQLQDDKPKTVFHHRNGCDPAVTPRY